LSGGAGDRGVCVVAGVGPGTGLACVERFANGGYQVAMLARREDRLKEWAATLSNTHAFASDVTDRAALDATFDAIRNQLGPVDALVYNAAMGSFSEFMDLEPEVLENNFQINTMGLFHCGQLAAADMLSSGGGSIVITGNTSARRGKANFAGFAPTKAAQRILGESMARSLGPKGIHVSYLVIDAVIDLEWTRKRMPDAPDDYFAKPTDIAECVWQLAHQPKSTWTFETEIRPFAENW
jgi:NAD(P)-dependent dehydrogenase (short-subunit alcohol dehydrogenase family)